MKSKQSPRARINRVIKFYYNRGINSERVNNLYRKILANESNSKTPTKN